MGQLDAHHFGGATQVMINPVMIVMYHYVRDLKASKFPRIKGLDARLFREQLAYLSKAHAFITPAQLIDALEGRGGALPPNSVLLTFDDGYRDHFDTALPIMQEFGASGIFFVPTRCIERRQVLDVNKIHFLLASAEDVDQVASAIDQAVDEARHEWPELRTIAQYRAEFSVANRFDPAVVIYIKRMLQHALPEALRARIVAQLFGRWVTADEQAFADELYLSETDLKQMQSAGMLIGSHGSRHLWMNTCDADTQATEIDESLQLLDRIGVPRGSWTFCYPYGGYNAETLALLRARGCRAGVTTRVDLARLDQDDPLLLPRLDTNDMPVAGSAPLNDWSQRQRAASAARQT
jgi:peptidoglycan/xylan/chitin deacetylase (PgdA/CDA1 family)